MPRKGRRRRRKLAPPPEHEGKFHNKPHEAKGRPMLPFTFVRQTRAKLRLLAIFLFQSKFDQAEAVYLVVFICQFSRDPRGVRVYAPVATCTFHRWSSPSRNLSTRSLYIILTKDFQGIPLGGGAMPARVARCFVFWRIFELFTHRERVYEQKSTCRSDAAARALGRGPRDEGRRRRDTTPTFGGERRAHRVVKRIQVTYTFPTLLRTRDDRTRRRNVRRLYLPGFSNARSLSS